MGGNRKKKSSSSPALSKALKYAIYKADLDVGLEEFAGIDFSNIASLDVSALLSVRDEFLRAMNHYKSGTNYDRACKLVIRMSIILDSLKYLNSADDYYQDPERRQEIENDRIRPRVLAALEECRKEGKCDEELTENIRLPSELKPVQSTSK